MTGWFIYAEDLLSESFAKGMVAELGFEIAFSKFVGGWSHLKGNFDKYRNLAAKGNKVLILTDLDQRDCAPSLLREWSQGLGIPQGLVLRVCVHEIESWLMADRDAFAEFLGFSTTNLPLYPDAERDPKRYLFTTIASKSRRREIKAGILPRSGSHVGPEYNSLMINFLKTDFRMDVARKHSPSLERALAALSRCHRA
ncbi:MAG: hypothetical protein HS115_05130 [Spirochaetales bacterium]|nr:hypothetical protein [Spirochaetales bacterium]